jgi:hypothetical protein
MAVAVWLTAVSRSRPFLYYLIGLLLSMYMYIFLRFQRQRLLLRSVTSPVLADAHIRSPQEQRLEKSAGTRSASRIGLAVKRHTRQR